MKRRLKKIHIGAGVTLIIYFAVGNSILAIFALRENIWEAIFIPMIYGSLASIVFLYIFCHESFFSFAKDLKNKQMKKERKLLRKTKNIGKKLTAVVATIVGGPILGALTIRLLLNGMRNKYLFLILANVPSTIFTVGYFRGIFNFFS